MHRVTDDPRRRRAPRWALVAVAALAVAALLAGCGQDEEPDATAEDPPLEDADADELAAELEEVRDARDDAERRAERLADERDDLEAERERLVDETDALREEIDRLAEAVGEPEDEEAEQADGADPADDGADEPDDDVPDAPTVDLDAGRLDLDADERAALLATLGGDPAEDASAQQARLTAQLHRLVDDAAAEPTGWREPTDLDVDEAVGDTANTPQEAVRDLVDAHVPNHVGGAQEASTVRAWRTGDDQLTAAGLVWGLDDEVRAGSDVRVELSGAQQGFAIDAVEVRDWCREGVEDDRCAGAD